jgi:hypothetical protein
MTHSPPTAITCEPGQQNAASGLDPSGINAFTSLTIAMSTISTTPVVHH